jgi:hypothetical protein
MQNTEPDRRLVEDITFFFEEKKRLANKNYKYISTIADDAYLVKAAKLCLEHQLDAATFVQKMYDRMGEQVGFFSPKCLQGTKAAFSLSQDDLHTWKIEVTNATLSPEDMWRYQHELASKYISNGESVESVLIDSSLKFFAWFRILATPDRVPSIITKYKHIAKKEMTNGLIAFAKSEQLDLDRLS